MGGEPQKTKAREALEARTETVPVGAFGGTEIARARARLEAAGVTNVSIFPGSGRDSTPERMAAELNRSLDRLEAGDFEVGTDDD